jgi:Cdc6-like AAA superfamily ATPase
MVSLSNIDDLKDILSRLSAEKPAGLSKYGNETKYQTRGTDLARRLKLEIDSNETNARVLITGQIGVGKSSELWNFYRQRIIKNSRTGYLVYCDLEKEEHPERCGATGVLLSIFRDCWGATKKIRLHNKKAPDYLWKKLDRLREEILEKLIDWLKGSLTEDEKKVVFNFGGMDFPIFLSDKDRALSLLLSKAAQHEAVSTPSERFGLVPDSLINLLNKLLNWFKDIHERRSPLLIIDHVDKIRDENSAKEVLTEIIPHWQRIAASIIMTAPYEYTLGELRNSVESYWGKPIMIYPLDIPEIDCNDIPAIYNEIVNSCQLNKFITTDSLRILAHYCGGIPRTFVQFLIEASKEAHLANNRRIEESDAQAIIYNAERAYQDYGPNEMDLLTQITENKIGLNAAATLLRSPIGLLVMKSKEGEQPLRVHPLAKKVLQRYRYTKSQEKMQEKIIV